MKANSMTKYYQGLFQFEVFKYSLYVHTSFSQQVVVQANNLCEIDFLFVQPLNQ